ncbi:flagellar assembly protein FliH [Sphingomonas naasensis]|uniref:Flagellar assembly protein FliH n=1 Tax=Sphingomonas naasensis TaxID=1344951 RepID=A0A4S1WMW2_9SPHN|nr:FliH/SctL family protein [Sphingomonas naasensis]NIJ20818.1 flagellar assembly protein FliH [Sphingomonas naasensis]TGX43220.1 flagellar assembly protein FliH [Sphingomonas naasensis]
MGFQNVERFAFDRIFSTPASDGATIPSGDTLLEISALRAELALLRSDVDAQIAIARAEAFEAGLAQARAERDVALLSAVDALHAGIEALDERFDEVSTRVTGEAAEIALAAADMIAGRAVDLAPAEAIDAAIGRALGQVARGTELEIRVNPELIETIEARIADRQSKDRRKLNLTVVGDVTVAVGDARISWEKGGLSLDADARRAAVMEELETLLPPAAGAH